MHKYTDLNTNQLKPHAYTESNINLARQHELFSPKIMFICLLAGNKLFFCIRKSSFLIYLSLRPTPENKWKKEKVLNTMAHRSERHYLRCFYWFWYDCAMLLSKTLKEHYQNINDKNKVHASYTHKTPGI